MRLGVPYIAPRQLGAVESNPGRQILPSVDWCTGQSGVPPDRYCSMSGADCFPVLAQPTVEDLKPLAHRTLSGAHRTVRCSLLTVGSATRDARIVRPTVGSADSPVNYSRTPPLSSREQPFYQSQPGAPDTVRCTQTEHSLGCSSQVFSICLFSDSST
jgi:hypothetical protein